MPNSSPTKNTPSFMAKEATEAWSKIADQLSNNKEIIQNLTKELRSYNPHSVMIVGRGSSDHAGVFGKYLIEVETGIPTISAAPSVSTIYNRRLKLQGSLVIIISQSGQSPDILEEARQSKASGAFCIALLNNEQAPLADIVDFVIPLSMGVEQSVAATKSFLATLSALLQLVAYWQQDDELIDALDSIPQTLKTIIQSAPQLCASELRNIKNLIVLGRGFGYSIAKEIALKLKEVCAIHAEAFSSAEFLHGPVALAEKKLKVIVIEVKDESNETHHNLVKNIENRGADIFHLHQADIKVHPRIAPLLVLQRFYLDLEKVAIDRGLDPDHPGGLRKVTETL